MAVEFGTSASTARRAAEFAKAADEIGEKCGPEAEEQVLGGKSGLTPQEVIGLAGKEPATIQKTLEERKQNGRPRKQSRKAKGTDTQAIKSAIEQLEAASHAFSKTLYEKGGAGQAAGTSNDIDTGPAAGAGSHATQQKPDDDVIEGEFEVKK